MVAGLWFDEVQLPIPRLGGTIEKKLIMWGVGRLGYSIGAAPASVRFRCFSALDGLA